MLRLLPKDLISLSEEHKLLLLDASLSQNHLGHFTRKCWIYSTFFIALLGGLAGAFVFLKTQSAVFVFLSAVVTIAFLLAAFSLLRVMSYTKMRNCVRQELKHQGIDISDLSHLDISEHIYVPMMSREIEKALPGAVIHAERDGRLSIDLKNVTSTAPAQTKSYRT